MNTAKVTRKPRNRRAARAAPKPARKQQRAQRKPRQRQPKTVRSRATAPNAFEPRVTPNMDTRRGTYSEAMVDYTRLSPSLQFELACANPGKYRAPYVENGRVLDIPTQLLAGYRSVGYTPAVSDTSFYTLVGVDSTATTVYSGTCGIHMTNTNNQSAVPYSTLNDYLSGPDGMTTYFGTSTYSDKILPYAMQLSVEILAPAAIVSGVVHIGSVSIAAIPGMKWSDFILRATTRIDLKSMVGQSINLRACIGNASLIHTPLGTTSSSYSDEWVSYAIFENVASPLTPGDGTTTARLSTYRVTVGVNAQAVWWPDGSQPALAGLADSLNPPQSKENAARKAVDDENADALSKTHHHPTVFENITSVVAHCLKGISVAGVLNVMERAATVAPMIGALAGMFMDSEDLDLCLVLEDDAALFDWECTRETKSLHFSHWTPDIEALYDEYMDAREELTAAMKLECNIRRTIRDRFTNAEQRMHSHRGKTIVEYFEGDRKLDPSELYQELKAAAHLGVDCPKPELSTVSVPNSEQPYIGKRAAIQTPREHSTLTGRDEFQLPDECYETPKLIKRK